MIEQESLSLEQQPQSVWPVRDFQPFVDRSLGLHSKEKNYFFAELEGDGSGEYLHFKQARKLLNGCIEQQLPYPRTRETLTRSPLGQLAHFKTMNEGDSFEMVAENGSDGVDFNHNNVNVHVRLEYIHAGNERILEMQDIAVATLREGNITKVELLIAARTDENEKLPIFEDRDPLNAQDQPIPAVIEKMWVKGRTDNERIASIESRLNNVPVLYEKLKHIAGNGLRDLEEKEGSDDKQRLAIATAFYYRFVQGERTDPSGLYSAFDRMQEIKEARLPLPLSGTIMEESEIVAPVVTPEKQEAEQLMDLLQKIKNSPTSNRMQVLNAFLSIKLPELINGGFSAQEIVWEFVQTLPDRSLAQRERDLLPFLDHGELPTVQAVFLEPLRSVSSDPDLAVSIRKALLNVGFRGYVVEFEPADIEPADLTNKKNRERERSFLGEFLSEPVTASRLLEAFLLVQLENKKVQEIILSALDASKKGEEANKIVFLFLQKYLQSAKVEKLLEVPKKEAESLLHAPVSNTLLYDNPLLLAFLINHLHEQRPEVRDSVFASMAGEVDNPLLQKILRGALQKQNERFLFQFLKEEMANESKISRPPEEDTKVFVQQLITHPRSPVREFSIDSITEDGHAMEDQNMRLTIIERLKDNSAAIRLKAATLLVPYLGNSQVRNPFLQTLFDSDVRIQQFAAKNLMQYGADRAVQLAFVETFKDLPGEIQRNAYGVLDPVMDNDVIVAELIRLIHSKDMTVRRDAFLNCMNLKNNALLFDDLLALLSDDTKDVRDAVSVAFGERIRENRVRQAFDTALENNNPNVRRSAFFPLMQYALDHSKEERPLIEKLLNLPMPAEQDKLIENLCQRIDQPEIEEIVINLLSHEDPFTRQAVVSIIPADIIYSSPQLASAYEKTLVDKEVRVRQSSLSNLNTSIQPAQQALFVDQLENIFADVRTACVLGLKKRDVNDPDLSKRLRPLLNDPSVDVRLVAVLVLTGAIANADRETVEACLSSLRDTEMRVRLATVQGLRLEMRKVDAIRNSVLSLLDDAQSSIRLEVVNQCLPILDQLSVRQKLCEHISDPNKEVREAVVWTLVRYVQTHNDKEIGTALRRARIDTDEEVRRTVESILGSVGLAKQFMPTVRDRLSKWKNDGV